MSAGQRTYLLNRSDGKTETSNNLESLTSEEYQSYGGKEQKNEKPGDYSSDLQLSEQLEEEPVMRKKIKSKVKRVRSKKPQAQVSTLDSRLQSLSRRVSEGTNSSS